MSKYCILISAKLHNILQTVPGCTRICLLERNSLQPFIVASSLFKVKVNCCNCLRTLCDYMYKIPSCSPTLITFFADPRNTLSLKEQFAV